jgi:hypothetical protein
MPHRENFYETRRDPVNDTVATEDDLADLGPPNLRNDPPEFRKPGQRTR